MRRVQKALNRQLERVWRKLDSNLAEMNECKDRLADLKSDRESMISLAMKLVQTIKRPARCRDEWKQPADWRFKDDVGLDQVEHHGADLRLGGIERDAPAPAIAPEVINPASSSWSGPESPCQTSLPGGRRRIRD